jgi:hypothetical protein
MTKKSGKQLIMKFLIDCLGANVYTCGMAKQQTRLKNQVPNMTKKEALDILLQNVAESKRQIAKGQYYTLEESYFMLKAKK